MSIASEITRLQGVKSDILQAIADKGVTVPAGSALDDCPDLIASIGIDPTNIIYKTDFTNFNASTGVDTPIIGEPVTYTGLQNNILSSTTTTYAGKNFLEVDSLSGDNVFSTQTNIPVPTELFDFDFEYLFKAQQGASTQSDAQQYSCCHFFQSAAIGMQRANADNLIVFIGSSFNPTIVNDCTLVFTSGDGIKFFSFYGTAYDAVNRIKLSYRSGVMHIIVNEVERLYYTVDVRGKNYFYALSPRGYNKLFVGDVTYKKV